MPFRISAIVCAYNEEKTPPPALHSLFAQTRPPDEVIVVNNASTDQTRSVAMRVPGVLVDVPQGGARNNVNLAITLYREETWVQSRARARGESVSPGALENGSSRTGDRVLGSR